MLKLVIVVTLFSVAHFFRRDDLAVNLKLTTKVATRKIGGHGLDIRKPRLQYRRRPSNKGRGG